MDKRLLHFTLFQSDVIWFQIGLDEIVLSVSLRKAVCRVSQYDVT